MISQPTKNFKILIIGSGPAGLMAASQFNDAKVNVSIAEKKAGPGRKLLIAGSSGLNISYSAPEEVFYKFYSHRSTEMKKILAQYSPQAWLQFVNDLGQETFLGTSKRYFLRSMKSSPFLRSWIQYLQKNNVQFFYQKEVTDIQRSTANTISVSFRDQSQENFDAVCFCLGGGSYEEKEKPLRWVEMFKKQHIAFTEFAPSNVGYHVPWSEEFRKKAEGLALKNIGLHTKRGSKSGEMMVTRYGLEGPPVYFVGCTGSCFLDLQVDLPEEKILAKLSTNPSEKLTPLARVRKFLRLSPAAEFLLECHAPKEVLENLQSLAAVIKKFPLELLQARPLDEAISSAGGVSWDELDENMMLKKIPGVFCAGEMIDWNAPTGGFLIQGAVSTGYVAGQGIRKYLGL